MDLDDIFPNNTTNGIVLGEDLSQLSVKDLKDRIEALKSEITRVEREIEGRQSIRSAAEDMFKT